MGFESPAEEIPGNAPMDVLLKSLGFKTYTPKKRPKWFYRVQAEDVDDIPQAFLTASGSVQSLHEDDYLVMPHLEMKDDGEPEIYTMPENKALSYSRFNAPTSTRRKLPLKVMGMSSLTNMFKAAL